VSQCLPGKRQHAKFPDDRFGWSIVGRTHWIMPIIGTVWIGVGLAASFVCYQEYECCSR
jgi:hypothetical protein